MKVHISLFFSFSLSIFLIWLTYFPYLSFFLPHFFTVPTDNRLFKVGWKEAIHVVQPLTQVDLVMHWNPNVFVSVGLTVDIWECPQKWVEVLHSNLSKVKKKYQHKNIKIKIIYIYTLLDCHHWCKDVYIHLKLGHWDMTCMRLIKETAYWKIEREKQST